MNSTGPLLDVWNAVAFDRSDLPVMDPDVFVDAVATRVRDGWHLVGLFGVPEASLPLPLFAFLSHPDQGRLAALRTEVGDTYPALTPTCPQAARFEREVCEQLGVRPLGHPWLKPVRSHASYGPGSAVLHTGGEVGEDYPFFTMAGKSVHEVAVGPVHAGIIEPGHFRFQCHGEVVHHLEIVLGYQHRGLERALVGGPHRATLPQIEELSGDSTVAHSLAYCQLREALSGSAPPPRAQALRAVALELERLANHTGDLGALAGDVAFLPTAAFCGRLRGAFLNLTAELCGNRFGRAFLRPGGVSRDLSQEGTSRILDALARVEPDLRSAVELFFSTGSVLSRIEQVGVVPRATAVELGMVGVAARASGVSVDARHDHPTGMYRMAQVPVATATGGDVHARATVRWLEIQRSLDFVRSLLGELPAGDVSANTTGVRPAAAVLSVVEGWRGQVVHAVLTDPEGRFLRYKVVDPSFRNWAGLEVAVRGEQISDFPLCNKSFNLSYSGHDL